MRAMLWIVFVGLLAAATAHAENCGADLCVGPSFALKRPSEAAAVAKDGQSIGIAAGVYENDVAIFQQHNLTIRGIGGYAHLKVATGVAAQDKAIWVIKGDNATIEHIEFSGASVPHMNGAGIRLEGTHLTVRHCFFHHNQTALLSGRNPASDIVVEHTELAWSAAPQRNPHGIYIGHSRSFTLKFSYVHHAHVGHLVKSRARENYVLYNRIVDENEGASSYNIDIPNGGIAHIIGNIVQQGPRSENDALIAFGAERQRDSYPTNELYVVNNTLINDAPRGRFISSPHPNDVTLLVNNVYSGPGTWFDTGPKKELRDNAVQRGNVAVPKSDLVDAQVFDYRLKAGSKAIDAGVTPGKARDFDLTPRFEYLHKAQAAQREIHGPLDAGAVEFGAR